MSDVPTEKKQSALQRRHARNPKRVIRAPTFLTDDDYDFAPEPMLSDAHDIEGYKIKELVTERFDLHAMLYSMTSTDSNRLSDTIFSGESRRTISSIRSLNDGFDQVPKITSIVLSTVLQCHKDQVKELMDSDVSSTRDKSSLSEKDSVLPLYYIIRNKDRILSNERVVLQEKELLNFCVKLAWLYPDALDSSSVLSQTSEQSFDKTEAGSSTPNFYDEQKINENGITHLIVFWLREVYSNVFMVEKGFDAMSHHSSDKREHWQANLAHFTYLATEDLTCTNIMFRHAKMCRGADESTFSNLEPLNIEVKAPHKLLKAPSNVVFLLRFLSLLISQKMPTYFYLHYLKGSVVSLEDAQLAVDEMLGNAITSVSVIPGFIKTLLYLSEDSRDEVFSLKFMKHVICSDKNTRSWLIPLLWVDKEHAISYMDIVSKYLSPDVNGLINSNEILIEKASIGIEFDNEVIENKLKFMKEIRDKRDKFIKRFRTHQIDRHIFYAVNAMGDEQKQRAVGLSSIQYLVDERFKTSRFP